MTDNSPLAFPSNGNQHSAYDGMTLRDWFAGQALVGIMTQRPDSYACWAEANARNAYAMADAMLAARGEP